MNIRHRLAAAWHAFKHADNAPYYAVVYDLPDLDEGERTGDIVESYYEAFNTPAEAAEMFRTAYPKDLDANLLPEDARLVMILGDIDRYGSAGS